ncbi:hypothetical protein [Nocardia sp. BMG51109]|uniref:hypothetical protein n=1 Tax=Nocardia sp. BMG51109 TaxID=1056816 RepID=UPI000465121B|nr:hypothetical protein [Nocardia sp. BMG51109]
MWLYNALWIGLVGLAGLGVLALIVAEVRFRLRLRRLPKDRRQRRKALRELGVPEYPADEIEGPSGVPPNI